MNFNFQKNGFIKPQILNKPVIHTVDPIERIFEQKKIRTNSSTNDPVPTPVYNKPDDLQQRMQTLRELRK